MLIIDLKFVLFHAFPKGYNNHSSELYYDTSMFCTSADLWYLFITTEKSNTGGGKKTIARALKAV